MIRRRAFVLGVVVVTLIGCRPPPAPVSALEPQDTLPLADFVAVVERVSESGGFFDTDNLISNETGYLNVMNALAARGLRGGAYVGVGPDQNYSYIAELRPEVAFITDVRRDNLLHHLLLKALVEGAPTRIEFLASLHGMRAPTDAAESRGFDVERVVARVDSAWFERRDGPAGRLRADGSVGPLFDSLHAVVRARIDGYGLDLAEEEYETIRRFHTTFAREGLGLRFTSHGRPPRPYYPTYRQLTLETDVDGDRVSYLASAERYDVVRSLHLANRIIPVVGDLSGPDALRELGAVMREMGVELSAFYTSNVEYYLWQARSFEGWIDNARALPAGDGAVVIRSYFGNRGRHPSSVRGYYATQILQPWAVLAQGGFSGYWDTITRDVLPLR